MTAIPTYHAVNQSSEYIDAHYGGIAVNVQEVQVILL